MDKSLDFYQIYYKDEQLTELYDFAIPYRNHTLTKYFENDVIKDLVPKSTADYISVCSWRLKQKRGQGSSELILKNRALTLEVIVTKDFDIAILTPRSPGHHIMNMASNWHGKAWDDAINELRKFINVPDELIGNAIYENHFIARREIYQDYVQSCLLPCMAFMEGNRVFLEGSGYRNKKRDKEEIKMVTEKLGMDDWPIAPFVLERLFRIWIEGKRYNIINL